MSELSMHELEAQTGEVLPEREALSVGFAVGSFNHRTTHITTVNAGNASSAVAQGFGSTAVSSAHQTVIVNG
jgi:hypothetical protein